VFTILAVAAISGWISYGERASGDLRSGADWVRTADGWERRTALTVESESPSRFAAVHPGLVAAFQLTASLLVLVAIPGRAVPATAVASPALSAPIRRARRRELAEFR
jgi:hypothetical protein